MNFKIVFFRLLTPIVILGILYDLFLGTWVWDSIGYNYLPLSFGVTIGVFNFRIERLKNKWLQLIFVILISFMSFYLNFLVSLGMPKLLGLNEVDSTSLFKVFVFLVSPTIVLCAYLWFYKIKFTKTILGMITVSSSLVYVFAFFNFKSYAAITNQLLNPYSFWQVIVAFSLQLMVYKQEMFKSSKAKV